MSCWRASTPAAVRLVGRRRTARLRRLPCTWIRSLAGRLTAGCCSGVLRDQASGRLQELLRRDLDQGLIRTRGSLSMADTPALHHHPALIQVDGRAVAIDAFAG